MISSVLPFSDEGRKSIRSYPTIVHVAVLSAFVLPIAFLPYWAARRQIFTLRQRVERLEIGAKHLGENLYITSSRQRWTKDELKRIQSRVQNTIKESRAHVDRQEVNDETTRAELGRLWQEAQQSRNAQAATLHALGISLADIAAFIEETDLCVGKDTRQGLVARMRSLALNFIKEKK